MWGMFWGGTDADRLGMGNERSVPAGFGRRAHTPRMNAVRPDGLQLKCAAGFAIDSAVIAVTSDGTLAASIGVDGRRAQA